MRLTRLSLVALTLLVGACGRTTPVSVLNTKAVAKVAAASAAAPSVTVTSNGAQPAVTVSQGKAEAVAPKADPAPSKPSTDEPAVPNELIVHFKGDSRPLPGADLKGAVSGLQHTFVYQLKANAYHLDAVDNWQDGAPDIDYVEPNYIYKAVGATTSGSPTNDPYINASWGVGAINAPDIWNLAQGDGITVAVVDTGVATNNPDLAGQLLPGINMLDHSSNTNDDHGHGTHCAGTIAAIANNGIGVAGVAPHAKILPIKVLDSSGSGTNETIANGILEAARRGARVINLSLGGADDSLTLRQAIATVEAQGCVVVCAGGNNGNSQAFYPAACDGAIGVGAVDKTNAKASFSNYGTTDVSIAAPGVGIGSLGYQGGVVTMDGTSMAAPHVAGVAAQLLSVFPQLSAHNLLTAMVRGGRPTTGFSGGTVMAVNAEGALTAVGTLDTTAPTRVTGLTGTPGAPGEVQLSWAPATDNNAVAGYRVWRNGIPLGTVTTTSYRDAGINGSATYCVTAYDADGNEGQPSDSLAVSPGVASAGINGPTASERGTDHLTITWQTSVPMRCALSFGDTAFLGTDSQVEATAGTQHSIAISSLSRFHKYYFRVTALDAAGQPYYSDIKTARTKIWWLF